MKRLLALLAGGLGLGALLRSRGRRPAFAPSPADDLRAKLEAARTAEPVEDAADLDTRRADVHARARQAIDDLGEPS